MCTVDTDVVIILLEQVFTDCKINSDAAIWVALRKQKRSTCIWNLEFRPQAVNSIPEVTNAVQLTGILFLMNSC